jgi:hypothetical protein
MKKPLPVLRRVVRYEIMTDRSFYNIRRYREENVTVFLKLRKILLTEAI